MSRLDQHVGLVRFKLALSTFVMALPLAGTMLAAGVFVVVAVEHLTRWELHHAGAWLWAGAGLAVAGSLAYAIWKRPTVHQAAVAIDERLGLQEKFSTALYVRSSADPFAAAAVRDAEKAAETANLGDKFAIQLPRRWTVRLLVATIIALCTTQLPHYTLFSTPEAKGNIVAPRTITRAPAEQLARQAIAEAEAAPREVMDNERVKMAVAETQKQLDQPNADPVKTQQKAQDLLKDVAAIKQKIAEANKFVTDNNAMKALESVGAPSPEETGPVADAQRAMAANQVDKAVEELKKTVDNFDKMDKKEQEKAAEQMQQLAQQVQKQAADPKTQQAIKDELKKAGVDEKTAEQMKNLMNSAANGDKQAAQKLQQMANQAAQQANQNSNGSQQQQQAAAAAIKAAMQNAQQKANSQAGAKQISQTTSALAQAMKQAAQGQQGPQQQQGQKQGQQNQQANGQKSGQGQKAQSQGQQAQAGGQGQKSQGQGQSQQAQASGQGQQGQQGQNGQGQGQQGQGQGQGQQGQGGQQTAQQMMQQQVAQLDAMAKDQQGVAAQQGQQGQGQGQQGEGQGQQANGQWGQGQQGQGQGNGQQGNQQGQGQGQGQAGVGGRRPDPEAAPFDVKKEYSESKTIEDGKIIAKSFVKAPAERGTSTIKMGQAIDSESKADAGEVEPDRIPRSAQKAVKDYFDTLKEGK